MISVSLGTATRMLPTSLVSVLMLVYPFARTFLLAPFSFAALLGAPFCLILLVRSFLAGSGIQFLPAYYKCNKFISIGL